MAYSTNAVRKLTGASLKSAVHRAKPLSRAGLLERMFTFAFSNLVYPQIWEDPVVDMKALEIGPGHEVVAIASGGCNVLSYLTADPASVTAVDINGAHIALGKLKICALQNLSDYQTFFRFFGRADARANLDVYDRRLRPKLDPATRAYWDKRRAFGRRRIGVFARNLYRHGLPGYFLGARHTLVRLHGLDPSVILTARTLEEQRALYEERLAPIFDKPLGSPATSLMPTITSRGRRSVGATLRVQRRLSRPICRRKISIPSGDGRSACVTSSAR